MDYMDWECLKRYWRIEIMGGENKSLNPRRLIRRVWKKELAHYLFWFRLGQHLHRRPKGIINYRKIAKRIHASLLRTHGIDIMLECEIGPGLNILHRSGIVIADAARIGANLRLRQNTTIGIREVDQLGKVYLGDNVDIGPHTCIIGDDLYIGNNVTIGAMAFVNKNIPDDNICYTKHVATLRHKKSVSISS